MHVEADADTESHAFAYQRRKRTSQGKVKHQLSLGYSFHITPKSVETVSSQTGYVSWSSDKYYFGRVSCPRGWLSKRTNFLCSRGSCKLGALLG